MMNTSEYYSVNPHIFDNSKRSKDYKKHDQVTVIDLSNYETDKETPFKAIVKEVRNNNLVVQCMDTDKTFEVYDYQFADRIV